jgi:Na+/phosphate symporter
MISNSDGASGDTHRVLFSLHPSQETNSASEMIQIGMQNIADIIRVFLDADKRNADSLQGEGSELRGKETELTASRAQSVAHGVAQKVAEWQSRKI